MYKIIKIGGEDYKFEFSIEASLYAECIEKITGLMFEIDNSQTEKDVKGILTGMSDIPHTAITCFYAGLLEHHGASEYGDGKVPNMAAAKRLAVALLKDEESEISNWYDLFMLCVNQMGEDGFFDLVGIPAMISAGEEPQPNRAARRAAKKAGAKSS